MSLNRHVRASGAGIGIGEKRYQLHSRPIIAAAISLNGTKFDKPLQ
jgi:hypothetical protein